MEGLTRYGLAGAFLLGVLFAVTFHPISAALFFGSLLPLSVSPPAQLPLFVAYGLATAVPVAIVTLLVLLGASGGANALGGLERWPPGIQAVTGWIILAVGIYLTLTGTLTVV